MIKHESDCATNNLPALPVGECDCKFEKFNELESLAKPLQDWMLDNFDPMCKIEIDTDGVHVWGIRISAPMLAKGL